MGELKRVNNAPWFLDPLQFKQPLMLDIGSGGFSSDEKFTSVDLFVECDIQASMWEIPLPDGSVDAIYSSNALEHVGKKEVVPTLREWHRLLKVGGRLQLLVPDLEWACQWWLANQEDLGWSLDIIYGHQLHDGEYHKTGFTPQIMQRYFDMTEKEWFINKIEHFGGTTVFDASQGPVAEITQMLINVEAAKI
jgi:predicted SAM-dependent methyltransferase